MITILDLDIDFSSNESTKAEPEIDLASLADDFSGIKIEKPEIDWRDLFLNEIGTAKDRKMEQEAKMNSRANLVAYLGLIPQLIETGEPQRINNIKGALFSTSQKNIGLPPKAFSYLSKKTSELAKDLGKYYEIMSKKSNPIIRLLATPFREIKKSSLEKRIINEKKIIESQLSIVTPNDYRLKLAQREINYNEDYSNLSNEQRSSLISEVYSLKQDNKPEIKVSEIRNYFGISNRELYKIINMQGCERRKKIISKEQRRNIIEMYQETIGDNQFYNTSKIAEKMGVSKSSVYRIINKEKISRRKLKTLAA